MGIGVPFIFQILLLLALPLAFAYLISLAGLLFVSIRAILRIKTRKPRRAHSASGVLHL